MLHRLHVTPTKRAQNGPHSQALRLPGTTPSRALQTEGLQNLLVSEFTYEHFILRSGLNNEWR